MAQREGNLLAEIERDALDDDVPVATTLRKCIVLGGKSGSEELRDWATRELKGYHGEDDLPEYRIVPAPLLVDGFSGNAHVTRQPFPPSGLPEFAQENIKEEVQLRDGVGSIEALVQQEEIKLAPAMAADLVRYMNAKSEVPFQEITHLYWGVSPAAIQGVLDQIRTALTQLVAELRANMPAGEEVPSAEAADQAVSVVVTGKRSKVNVTTAQTTGDSSPATPFVESPSEESGFWTRWRRVGAFIVGLAAVGGVVITAIEAF
jgi:hypothetical protein